MKKGFAAILALCMILSLTACGRREKHVSPEPAPAAAPVPTANEPFEVRLTLDNLYQYFDYKEFRADVRDEVTSEIDSATIAYGLQLKEQFTAVNDGEHKDTMVLRFSADGVVLSGSFDIDFDDLSFTGTTDSAQTVEIREELHFWPKGNRTTTWTYGNYSSSNIMYLEHFVVTDVSGSVFLKMAEPDVSPTPTFIPHPTP